MLSVLLTAQLKPGLGTLESIVEVMHTSFRHLPSSKLFFCIQSEVSVIKAPAGTSTTHFGLHKLANDTADPASGLSQPRPSMVNTESKDDDG
jgi:hypothetical protein